MIWNSKWKLFKSDSNNCWKLILITSHSIPFDLKKSYYLLSWKSLGGLKYFIWIVFKWKFKSFQKPFSFQMEEVMSSSLKGFVLKWIWISRDQNARWKFGKVISFPLIKLSKSFKFHSLTVNQSNKQSNNQSYLVM